MTKGDEVFLFLTRAVEEILFCSGSRSFSPPACGAIRSESDFENEFRHSAAVLAMAVPLWSNCILFCDRSDRERSCLSGAPGLFLQVRLNLNWF